MSVPRTRRSRTPDINLPGIKNRDWATDINRMLCIDESLNDSGAALFVDTKYIPQTDVTGKDVGFFLKQSPSKSQQERIVAYHDWVANIISTHKPDVVIGESHPFARGNRNTSIVTLEVMAGVRYVTMLICGKLGVPYVEFSTNYVKLMMCDSTAASKEMIQLVLQGCGYDLPIYFGKNEINGNVCDAIAMGEVLSRMQRQEIIRKQLSTVVGNGRSQTQSRRKRNA